MNLECTTILPVAPRPNPLYWNPIHQWNTPTCNDASKTMQETLRNGTLLMALHHRALVASCDLFRQPTSYDGRGSTSEPEDFLKANSSGSGIQNMYQSHVFCNQQKSGARFRPIDYQRRLSGEKQSWRKCSDPCYDWEVFLSGLTSYEGWGSPALGLR